MSFSRVLQKSDMWGLGFFLIITVVMLLANLRGENAEQAWQAKKLPR